MHMDFVSVWFNSSAHMYDLDSLVSLSIQVHTCLLDLFLQILIPDLLCWVPSFKFILKIDKLSDYIQGIIN